jgi:hypothetical protein
VQLDGVNALLQSHPCRESAMVVLLQRRVFTRLSRGGLCDSSYMLILMGEKSLTLDIETYIPICWNFDNLPSWISFFEICLDCRTDRKQLLKGIAYVISVCNTWIIWMLLLSLIWHVTTLLVIGMLIPALPAHY